MKISELIEELEKHQELFGDLECLLYHNYEDDYWAVDRVDAVKGENLHSTEPYIDNNEYYLTIV